MLPYSFRFSRIIIVIFFVFAIAYGIFEAQGILLGPRIDVETLPVHTSSDFVRIQGTATHIASISMNGADIPVTETGAFDEPYLLGPGRNDITLVARDKYGNTSRKAIILYYEGTATAPALPSTADMPATATTSSTASSTVAD